MPISIDSQPADYEIECGRCGATIYLEITRCPKCGFNLYEPDDRIDQDYQEGSSPVTPQHRGFFTSLNGFLRKFTKHPYLVDDLFGAVINQVVIYNDLLGKVGGDHSAVERLFNFESQLLPDGTRLTWIENAMRHWKQDNLS
ncbi:MAG: hypothetical protein ABIJ65_15150 [Chloroflexota bacterium]